MKHFCFSKHTENLWWFFKKERSTKYLRIHPWSRSKDGSGSKPFTFQHLCTNLEQSFRDSSSDRYEKNEVLWGRNRTGRFKNKANECLMVDVEIRGIVPL